MKNWKEVEEKWGVTKYHIIKYFRDLGYFDDNLPNETDWDEIKRDEGWYSIDFSFLFIYCYWNKCKPIIESKIRLFYRFSAVFLVVFFSPTAGIV